MCRSLIPELGAKDAATGMQRNLEIAATYAKLMHDLLRLVYSGPT